MAAEMAWTAKERLLTAMRGGRPDRVPVVVRGVRPWDDAWVQSRHASYAPLIDAVARLCDWEAYWGVGARLHTAEPIPTRVETEEEPDWTVHTTYLRTPAGELRMRHKTSKRGLPGMQIEFPVKEVEHVDWVLAVPYKPVYPGLESLHQLHQAVGDRGVVIVSMSDPIAYVHELLGSELLAIWSIEHPDIIDTLVQEFTRRVADTLSYLLEGKAAEVYGFSGEEYLSPPLAAPRHFWRWVVEPERSFGEMIHAAGYIFWVHCHGPLRSALRGFVEMGVDCLHPVEAPPMGDVTLRQARQVVGSMCLEGNIQIGDIYAASEADVRQLVRQAIEEGAAGAAPF
ncbi:MAG: hypothetical protein H5T86_15895, partial [Armatimonadetes bacterium]|nr:hypothetical protein [Armatimonadota bacterium]